MFRAARLEPRAGAARGPLQPALLHLAVFFSGALGLFSESALESSLVWLALWTPALGAAARGLELHWHGLLPLAWAFGLALLFGEQVESLGLSLSLLGLYAAGALAGALLALGGIAAAPWSSASAALLLAGLLTAAPAGGGMLARPWPPEVTALLLDLSPVVLVTEAAGLDWMRHASLYELAGTGDLPPDMRMAWSPGVAMALAALTLGALAWALERRAGRKGS